MKIGLIGYGKMGKEIESICKDRGHEISGIWDSSRTLDTQSLAGTDVAIEFTRPDTAVQHILTCIQAGVRVVVGTTGWYDDLEKVTAACSKAGATVFSATNFSLGVNIAFYLNEQLAAIMAKHSSYGVSITEIHHTRKLDEPSGTAISFAEGIMQQNPRFKGWSLTPKETFATEGSIPVHAMRSGDVPGTHIITYKSPEDRITLSHEAFNRKGFALGAVLAAEWCMDKKGMLGMKDMLNFANLK